jgi:hypothetical protein
LGRGWAKTAAGLLRQGVGRGAGVAGPRRFVLFLFFFFSISSLKQANTFEFKSGFESKHPKTKHRQESYTHTTIYLI